MSSSTPSPNPTPDTTPDVTSVPPISAQETASPPKRKRSGSTLKYFLLIALLCLAVAGGVGAFLFYNANKTTDADYIQLVADYARRFGPRATLDEKRYTDSDGDLLADVPKDRTALLDPKEIVFTGITMDEPKKAQATWKPLTDHLSEKIGRPVKFDPSLTSVETQLTALREGKLHVTAFSTGGVPAAVNSSGFVPVCVPANEDGKYAYQMEIIVPAGSSIQKADDLKGRQVTFSSMSSNAGMKAPIYLLREKFGLHLGKDYSFIIAGGYRPALQGIASGRTEAAPVPNDYLRREVARGTLKKEQYRTIYTSEDFPPLCFGHAYNLNPELAAKIRKAFLSFPWKGTTVEKEYGPAGLTQFVPINYRKDWALVRTVDEGMLRLANTSR